VGKSEFNEEFKRGAVAQITGAIPYRPGLSGVFRSAIKTDPNGNVSCAS
jgi:hypothetical protein